MEIEKVHKMINELKEYSEIEGTEIGELCGFLETVLQFSNYYLTAGFEKAVVFEMRTQLENFKQHAKIIKRETTSTHTISDLEWDA